MGRKETDDGEESDGANVGSSGLGVGTEEVSEDGSIVGSAVGSSVGPDDGSTLDEAIDGV